MVKNQELGQSSYEDILLDIQQTVDKAVKDNRDFYYIGIVLIPNDTSKEYIPKFASRLSEYNRNTESTNIKFYTPGYIRTERADISNYQHITGSWYFNPLLYEEFTENFCINKIPIKEQLDGSGIFIIDFETFLKLNDAKKNKYLYWKLERDEDRIIPISAGKHYKKSIQRTKLNIDKELKKYNTKVKSIIKEISSIILEIIIK